MCVQEFRVRYRYKGSMRLKTLSCSRFGREGAKLLTGAFVARWEATGRTVAERTNRSRLALADLTEDTAQLPAYARKRTDSNLILPLLFINFSINTNHTLFKY